MSTLASRFAALKQQVSEKRSSSAVSPRRFTPSSQTSSRPHSTGEEDDDSVFPQIEAFAPITPANPVVGQRRRRDSEDDSNAVGILRARQAQLDRDRLFAKERMKYHSLSDIQTEIDITAFAVTTTDQKLIEVRIVQEVEIKTMKAALIAMTSQSRNTNTKLNSCVTAVITSPRIPLYVTGVYAALLKVAKHSPHLLGLPAGFDSSATTWVDTAKNISDYLTSGRSAMRQKLQNDVDGGSKPARPNKGKGKKLSGRMPLARLAAELFGKQGSIDSDSLGRAALLRSLYRDHQKAVRDSQSPTKKTSRSAGSSVDADGTPIEQEETGDNLSSGSGQDAETGSGEDASPVINSTDEEVTWGPQSFWTFADYSFLTLHKSIAHATDSQAERGQMWDSLVTATIQSDFKDYPPSGTVEEDLELRASGLTRADDRPEYLVQLEAAVFKALELTKA
ncbi:hypothetical protein M407DRAFT_33082 [Tulasnella calospora MUT 4182]|uniref:Uncharacterized protein n=1 Tax=Tulasnella calospora MUT 4182 TaxID=1051891 RepID=A0A0C3K774_9AGAM|nr:hypothetical protein M407DRAFT_33082 [Tulasnella calospora MUT 4182]